MLSERQTPGFKSPWGQPIGGGSGSGKPINDEEVDEPVFIDKMPWTGDPGDRVSVLFMECVVFRLIVFRRSFCSSHRHILSMCVIEFIVPIIPILCTALSKFHTRRTSHC